MSFINRSSKEMYCKIIYAGPNGSGKTTNIQWIYKRINTSNKDAEFITLPLDPPSTSLFDFLPVGVGDIRGFSTRFHLYTMVSQDLFNTTGKIILKGIDGLVFVANSDPMHMNTNIEYFNQLKTHLKDEGYDIEKIPLIIQYNKRDLNNAEPVFQMKNKLNHYNSPDIEAIAKTGKGVFDTFKMISKLIISSLQTVEL